MKNSKQVVKIGVFDSGIGGLSVANAIKRALPNARIIFANDHKNCPYGAKSPDLLLKLVVPILTDLVKQGCQIIVIACNTVTTTIISQLRQIIPVPLIGMGPMVKPAALKTRSGVIAICATPTTLASKRYAWLKKTYAKQVKVIEPDCSDWTLMIESNHVDRQRIHQEIDTACKQSADVIVLGCTHYHWVQDIIKKEAAGRAIVLQPEKPVIKQLKRVIEQLV
jgi:glutamate racemase